MSISTARFISSRLDFKGGLAVAATSISFLIIIVAVAVSAGFRHEIHGTISRTAGDVQVTPDGKPLSGIIPLIEAVEGVESVSPVVYAGGMVKAGDKVHGVVVKGVEDPDCASMTVSIPEKLSALLETGTGDSMVTWFAGDKVKVRKFKVGAILDSSCMLSDGDNLTVIAPLDDMRKVAGMGPEECSLIEVTLREGLRNPDDMRAKAGEISIVTGLYARAASDRFSNLYSWLEVIDANVLVILVLLSIVAGFNMISGLLIMLFRNISTIGTLKTLGMDDRSIGLTFLRVASRVTLAGMAIGNVLALLFCLIQGSTHLLKLDPANYFVSFVPVRTDIPLMLAADLAAYLVIMLLELLPTLFISRVDPAQNVRVR